jgi:hypothetical protein
MSEFRKIKQELQQQPSRSEYRCRYCGETAAYETLSSYGARCGACYADYSRRGFEKREPSSYAKKLNVGAKAPT